MDNQFHRAEHASENTAEAQAGPGSRRCSDPATGVRRTSPTRTPGRRGLKKGVADKQEEPSALCCHCHVTPHPLPTCCLLSKEQDGEKYLGPETRRPGSLAWSCHSLRDLSKSPLALEERCYRKAPCQ